MLVNMTLKAMTFITMYFLNSEFEIQNATKTLEKLLRNITFSKITF